MLVAWIPETIGTGLMLAGVMTQREWIKLSEESTFWHVFATGYPFIALAWYLVLFPIAVTVAQRLSWVEGAVVGSVTLALAGFLMLMVIR